MFARICALFMWRSHAFYLECEMEFRLKRGEYEERQKLLREYRSTWATITTILDEMYMSGHSQYYHYYTMMCAN